MGVAGNPEAKGDASTGSARPHPDASTRAQGDERYIYADNAATTPLSPHALEAMMPYLTHEFGNPSGIHRVSRDAATALSGLRARMAAALGADAPGEIYFTSGGSESDNWILRGAVRRFRDAHPGATPRVITSAIEHHAILHCLEALEREGVHATYLPVDELGRVNPSDLEAALVRNDDARSEGAGAPGTALVSIMLANNEVGTVQDVAALAEVTHAHGAPFHTDAVQAAGHIPVDVRALGVDALSLSAHKFHGPHGMGVLYLREGLSIPPLIAGGAQERGERAGTENLAGVAGMVAALEGELDGLDERARRVATLRGELTQHVLAEVPDVILTGDPSEDPARRLPSIASFACHNVDGELLTVLLDRAGVAAATGSACATGSTDPSHVVVAMGRMDTRLADPRWNHGTLRLSLSDDVTRQDVEALCERVPRCIKRARALSATV